MISNFKELIKTCMDALHDIWPNPFNILKFWCIKYAENPTKAREVNVDKDSYDRQDNYDG